MIGTLIIRNVECKMKIFNTKILTKYSRKSFKIIRDENSSLIIKKLKWKLIKTNNKWLSCNESTLTVLNVSAVFFYVISQKTANFEFILLLQQMSDILILWLNIYANVPKILWINDELMITSSICCFHIDISDFIIWNWNCLFRILSIVQ